MKLRSRVLALLLLSVVLFGSSSSSSAARQSSTSSGVTPQAVTAGSDSCATPTAISTLPYNDSGSTTNASDQGQFINPGGCTASGMISRPGPDVVYTFTVFPGNSLTITLTPAATYDADLYVWGSPCASNNNCVVESDSGIEGQAETIGPRTFAPGTYYIYVDSIYSPEECTCDRGTYTLSVTGSLGTPNNTSFYTVTPCRVLDTRNPTGPRGGPALVAGATRTFTITGTAPGECQIPLTAKAVSINVTVTSPTSLGFLTLFPGGTTAPLASTINFRAGQTRANNAIVPLGTNGTISVLDGQPSGTTHFILDVNGYFQ
jgi:hypothetical protein